MFDFAGLFLVATLVRNLYTGDPCEGVRSFPPQTKHPRYGPAFMLRSLRTRTVRHLAFALHRTSEPDYTTYTDPGGLSRVVEIQFVNLQKMQEATEQSGSLARSGVKMKLTLEDSTGKARRYQFH